LFFVSELIKVQQKYMIVLIYLLFIERRIGYWSNFKIILNKRKFSMYGSRMMIDE